MAETEIREIDRFEVVSEDGRKFMIIRTQTIIISRTHDGAVSRIPGLKHIKTREGYSVNYLDENNFFIVELELKVKRMSK